MEALRPLDGGDLDHVLERTGELWEQVRGKRILLTGGTGFFGSWLVESFLHANQLLRLRAQLFILSRKPQAFAARSPQLALHPAVTLLEGDIRSFAFPEGRFSCVIHAATDSAVPAKAAAEEYSVIVDGTRRVVEFAAAAGAERMLLVSSGSIYGPQPLSVSHIDEEHPFARSESAYAVGKRDAESLCLKARLGMHVSIARGFAFVGPHLPLDRHFAAGNFLRNALEGRDIAIRGDGTPLRSYLYAADLAVWLWTILLKGSAGRAYNVGSEEAISIQGLAGRVIAGVDPLLQIRVAHQQNWPPPAPARYVPSTRRARVELGLESWIGLDEAIRRTAAWYRG